MTNLAIIEEHPITPADQVGLATEMANQLKKIVEEKQLFEDIKGKKHLKAEAWQTIVAFNNAHPITEYCVPIRDGDGEIIAYEAKVNIVKNGEVIASGIMPYGLDEFACRGQSGFGKHRAAYSTAQTLAGAKAARTKYAWVVVMAGYSGTPAEEIPRESPVQQNPKPATRRKKSTAEEVAEHYCGEHELGRNKDSKGRWYHKYGEDYCIEGAGLMDSDGNVVIEQPVADLFKDEVSEGQATMLGKETPNTMEEH